MTVFRTLDHTDLGGTVNIALGLDTELDAHNQTVEIVACLEHGREPAVSNKSLVCQRGAQLVVATDSPPHTATLLVPYPEPGSWYLGLQARCVHPDTRQQLQCWGDLRFASLMAQVDTWLSSHETRNKPR